MKRYGLWLAALWTTLTMAAQSPLEAQTSITQPKRIEILVKGERVHLFSATQYDSLIVVPDYGLKVYVKGQNSQDFLDATYREVAEDEPMPSDGENTNKNVNLTGNRRYAWRLEYPRTRDNEHNIISVHELPEPEGVTLSLEWDCEKKAQRWTCYQFHDGFRRNVSRTKGDPWVDDPNIPEQYRTHSKDYASTGGVYHRGHMCNSLDRLHSAEQNLQTFFISNAHPQFASHNTGLWKSLEDRVNKWGMDSNFRDTLYVVKAGTIDGDRVLTPMQSNNPGTQPVLVPKYMYMAILCKKGNNYKAIAFWTEHNKEPRGGRPLREFAKSIRELEKLTGIDFFCNLPDKIERTVEENLDINAWEW